MKLNQALAVRKGEASGIKTKATELYKALQKTDSMKGLLKVYRPKDEEGDQYPSEAKKVTTKTEDILSSIKEAYGSFFDAIANVEFGNHQADAVADVVVDGAPLLEKVPVAYLLFLEKQIMDLKTIFLAIPTLEAQDNWEYDTSQSLYKGEARQTRSTKKINIPVVLAPATDKHPAQVSLGSEDVLQGFWTTTDYSGMVPMDRKQDILEKLEKLSNAVKIARENCNMVEITKQEIGAKVLGFVLG